MKNIFIFLDPAHGIEVPGKRSPDGKHREYLWSRTVEDLLFRRLQVLGIPSSFVTSSENEIGLTNRKKIVEDFKFDGEKILISLHNNAAGDGSSWLNAQGVEIYTGIKNKNSIPFATQVILDLKSNFNNIKFREPALKEANFTVISSTLYTGILLEWLFQDNKTDVALLSDESMNLKLVESLIKSIQIYANSSK